MTPILAASQTSALKSCHETNLAGCNWSPFAKRNPCLVRVPSVASTHHSSLITQKAPAGRDRFGEARSGRRDESDGILNEVRQTLLEDFEESPRVVQLAEDAVLRRAKLIVLPKIIAS